MIRIRFNLGRGSNFRKWKIVNTTTKESIYLDPLKYSLILNNCLLKNNNEASKRIFDGHSKYVCAWIVCDNYEIMEVINKELNNEIRYNPRILPHWTNSEGENMDNKEFNKLITLGNKVYWSK